MTGWATVPFAEACSDVSSMSGRLPKTRWLREGALPIVDQGDSVIAGYTNDLSHAYRGSLPVIVFGDHTRRFKLVDQSFAIGADGVKLLAPSPAIDARYLFHFFASIPLPSAGYSRHFKFLKMVKIPVPPLEEQRRIASVLDAANNLRERRLRTLSAIAELASAVFAHTFTDTERRRWDYLSIGELCDTSSGGTPHRDVSDNFNGGVPWIKSSELHDSVVVSSEETITDHGLRSSSAKILPPGTVLVAMYGATAGAVSELAISAATNQAICALKPREKLRTPFLVFALRESMAELLALRAGGAQPNLSQARIREHQLPVPPLHLQDEFSALHRRVMFQKELTLQHLAQLNVLFASLQHRAFNGEL